MGKLIYLVVLSVAAAAVAQEDIECPLPGGQESSSATECARFTACSWSDTSSQCSMLPNGIVGYTVTAEPTTTANGFTVPLSLTSSVNTLFDGDISDLICEVIYHEDYHVQIKIKDANAARYEVPVPLILTDTPGIAPTYRIEVSGPGEPFDIRIIRNSTDAEIFSTYGALTYEDQFIQLTTLLPSTYLYGFGENTHERLRHQFTPRNTWPIFARDQPIGSGFMNEYGHHPYYHVVEDDEGNTHSVLFFSSNAMEYSTFMTSSGDAALTLRTIGGIVDLHFFLGPTPEDTNSQYNNMIGNPIHPPYWFFGFQLSRWGYRDPDHIREVRDRMKAAGIPQDVQTVDIDYMERYRDFTYDKTIWAELPQLIDELHADNLKVVLILDPGIVIDWDNYAPAQRGKDLDIFVKWMDPTFIPADQPQGALDYMVGYVWPDTKTVFPDFFKNETIDWWTNEMMLMYQELKFDALWIDMNEPANFGTDMGQPWNWPDGMEPWSLKCPYNNLDSPPYPTMMTRVGSTESKRISDHSLCMSASQTDGTNNYVMYDTHSLYGWSQSVASYKTMQSMFPGKRSVVYSRSTYPSSGRYAVHWLGDNSADWTHMQMSIIGMIEFNMFGIPTVGADICGFFNEPDMEMCARWQQLGAFYPFSRNHNANGNADQDPALDPTVAAISRDALLLRYTYLPHLYTLFHKASRHGGSVVRPLYNAFPTDIVARDIDDQFLWGDEFMVAPVLWQGYTARDVYFPQARWYDIKTGVLASAVAGTEQVSAPLDTIPVYVRGGAILPTQQPALTTFQSRKNPFGLTVALDENESAGGSLFYDDGEVEHTMDTSYMAQFSYEAGNLTSSIMHGEALVAGLYFDSITIMGVTSEPTSVTLNGTDVTFSYTSEVVSVTDLFAPLDQPLYLIVA